MPARTKPNDGAAARKVRAAQLSRQIKRIAKQVPTPGVAEPPAAFVRRRMAELAKMQKSKTKPNKRRER